MFQYTSFSLIEMNQMIHSWLKYIEDKVVEKEGLTCSNMSFSNCYLQSKSLKKKYLEVDNFLSVPISNSIRLLFNYKALMNLNIKVHKMGISWRHLILIVISEFFKEQSGDKPTYTETKSILGTIKSEESLVDMTEKELIETILKLWKIVR